MKSFLALLSICLVAATGSVAAAEFSDDDLVNLGQSYAQAVNERDADALGALISTAHLAKKSAEIAGDTSTEKQTFARAFESSIPNMSARMLHELERQQAFAVFLRIHEFDGMRGPLVRYNVGGGYNYALILPVATAKGTQISDLYFATSGELLSETVGVAAKLMSSPSETFLGKLFGVTDIDQDLVRRFQELGKLRQQNKLQEAFELLDNTQASVRDHRLILLNTIQISSQISEDLYRGELRRLAEHHKDDPRVAFMLLDHFFYENDLDAAMSIIDLMEDAYGADAVLYMFRANVDAQRGRLDDAMGFAHKAVQKEPDNEDARWTLVTVQVQAKKYADSVETLTSLKDDFGYYFTRADFEAEPTYAEFVKSAEFARWIDET